MEVSATKGTDTIVSSLCNLSCFACTQFLESASIIVRRLKRTYCWECWIHHCNFRFRKRLFELARPEKGSRHPDSSFGQPENVLIDYNGSTSALALLHLVRDALRAAAGPNLSIDAGQKNIYLPFKFTILFIHDETGNKSKKELNEELKLLRDWQASTWLEYGLDFPIIVSSLELSLSILQKYTNADMKEIFWRTLSSSPSEVESENTGKENSRSSTVFPLTFPFDSALNLRLNFLAQNFKTITSRKDFFQILRENLVVFIGREINCSKIFVSAEQTAMAIKMFSMMSLGRGTQLAEQMSLTTEIRGLKLARPLMDLALDDLGDYLKCLNCKWKTTTTDTFFLATTTTNAEESFISTLLPTAKRDGGKKRSNDKSIETQCEEFIVSLQEGFPSTVPTLTRIGAKLKPSPSLALTQTAFDSVLDVNETEEEYVTDRKEGKQMKKETSRENGSDRSNFFTRTAVCTFCKKNRNDTEDEEALELFLCYGCTSILRDMEEQYYFRELIQPQL